MPPKKHEDVASAVRLLCEVMVHSDMAKVRTKEMSTRLGLSRSDAIGVKVNALIGPCGYLFKGGKVTRVEGTSQDAPEPPTQEKPTSPAQSDSKEGSASGAPVATRTIRKAPRVAGRTPLPVAPRRVGSAMAASSAKPASSAESASDDEPSHKRPKLGHGEALLDEDEV